MTALFNIPQDYLTDFEQKFKGLPNNNDIWYKIDHKRPDLNNFIAVIQKLILEGKPYEFNDTLTKFKKRQSPTIGYKSISEVLDMDGIVVKDYPKYKQYWRGEVCVATETK